MLFVWAQFELQVGIMCASAPALRVFFRRYLGVSQGSSNISRGTVTKKSITVIHDTHIDFDRNGSAVLPSAKLNIHEMRDFGTPISERSEDGLSTAGRAQERDLTRYSHEEDHIGMNRLSWVDPASGLENRNRNGR